tara:strand:- start:593 stop:1507 length:915 start_codon:yes stop_codon:yes gene_type:complete
MDSIRNKNILVLGGGGFIGSNFVDLAISEKANVFVIDNLATGKESNISSKAEFLNFDASNWLEYDKLLPQIDHIFNFAALPRIQPSFDDPILHEDGNVLEPLMVLDYVMKKNIPGITFSSSSSVYGSPKNYPTTESEMIAPLNPYALQKYAAEQYCLLLADRFKFKANALRYFNVYGPRSFNPENPFNAYSSVIGIFEDAVKNDNELKITGDGSQKRDFVHVEDVAEANLFAALSDNNLEVYNIGNGKCISILEIAKLFSNNYSFIPEREGEAEITLADNSKAKNLLGWTPKKDVISYIDSLEL